MRKITREITVKNPQGIHARPAAMFVQVAAKYTSKVTLQKGDEKVNGKSIMGLLMLAASQGHTVEIEASGPDAEKAINELE